MKKSAVILFIFFILLLAIAGAIGSTYFYYRNREAEQELKKILVESEDDVRRLVVRVGRLMKLPDDELPAVVTVTDAEKLKDREFFADAKAGNKILIYNRFQKAILYDPVEDIIISVAPYNVPTVTSLPETTITEAENL